MIVILHALFLARMAPSRSCPSLSVEVASEREFTIPDSTGKTFSLRFTAASYRTLGLTPLSRDGYSLKGLIMPL